MRAINPRPKIYLAHGRWRFVPAVSTPGARERNLAAMSFIHALNRAQRR